MDIQVACIVWLQEHTSVFLPVFQGFAILGIPEFYILVIPLILWCYDRSLGIRILLLLSFSGAVADIGKLIMHTPRPYWVIPEVSAYSHYPSFGLPSSHAQNAIVFFGLIAAWFRKRLVNLVCILIILLIGLARVFQGVHYPSDIIAGFFLGLLLLFLFLFLEKPVGNWLCLQKTSILVFLVSAIPFALVSLSALALLIMGNWNVPPDWYLMAFMKSGHAITPLIPSDTVTGAGLLWGSAIGAILYSKRGSKKTVRVGTGSRRQKVLCYLIGIAILFCIWIPTGSFIHAAIGNGMILPGLVIQCIRCILAGLWITAGAPLLFVKIGLCRDEQGE